MGSSQYTQSAGATVPALCVRDVTIGAATPIAAGINMSIKPGESVAILGKSGTGKTTLLATCLGLMKPLAGNIEICGLDLGNARRRKILEIRRRHVGIIFQGNELLSDATPIENVALASIINGQPFATAKSRAIELLRDLDVPTDRSRTSLLSGGEQQRVAVARALVTDPELLVADEPTGSLDSETRDHVMRTIFDTVEARRCGFLFVTHDPVLARQATRTYFLASGKFLTP